MIWVGFDTETTGLDFEKGHRIIEIAMIGYSVQIDGKSVKHEEKFRLERRINPHRLIDAKAQLIHKISNADLIGKPSFKHVEPIVSKVLSKADLIFAHNLDFDARFLIGEYGLLKKEIPDVQGFCTMAEGRWATPLGKLPNLGELCLACEVDYDPDDAHAATYDTQKMAECFFFALNNDGFDIEKVLER